MRFLIVKKTNCFTTSNGKDIPILEVVSHAADIAEGADEIAKLHSKKDMPEGEYFLVEQINK